MSASEATLEVPLILIRVRLVVARILIVPVGKIGVFLSLIDIGLIVPIVIGLGAVAFIEQLFTLPIVEVIVHERVSGPGLNNFVLHPNYSSLSAVFQGEWENFG